MTTIIATKNTIYADNQLDDNGTTRKVNKVFRVQGAIVACCGDYSEGLAFMHWYKNPDAQKPELEDFEALMINEKGFLIAWDKYLMPEKLKVKFWAIGSGREFALGALHAGSTPQQALKIATKLDPSTGLGYTKEVFKKR